MAQGMQGLKKPMLHSGQDNTPFCAGECLHVGWRQVVQGIPGFIARAPSMPTCIEQHNKGEYVRL